MGDEGIGGEEAGESSDDEAVHVEGIRALATMTAFLSLLVPFLWIGYQWNYEIVEVAMEIALIALATSALPIKPLPGHEVWRWRQSLALLYVIGAFVLYFGYQLAFLPAGLLVPLGLVGGAFYVAVALWLRARSADAPPAWYRWFIDTERSWRIEVRTPTWVARASAATERTMQRTADGIHGAFAMLVQPVVGWIARRRRAKALAEVRRQNAALATELADVLSTFEGLDEEQAFTLVGDDGATTQRVGDFRDDAVRKVLKERLGDVTGPVTVIGPGGSARTVDLD